MNSYPTEKAIRTLANLNLQQSCKQAYQALKILTVLVLYNKEVILQPETLSLPTGKSNHSYNMWNAGSYVLPLHRTALFERKLSYIGRKLQNFLHGDLRHLTGDAMK